ncbi:MAG: hypothetical protein CME25_07520 [Gemmatimonadetes bacterium]|nr:hypothetical protein [Gemmatimonadota bacterium]
MIRIFSYSRESKRMETPSILELPRHLADRGRMIWADLEDPTDEETGVLGGMFGFHVLAVEDCMQEGLLPKFNLYDGYIFNIVHAAESKNTEAFSTIEVDIFVGENFLVTYHQSYVKGIFDSRGQVAKNPGSLLRSPDWLLYGILNAMGHNYEPGVQRLNDQVEMLENAFLSLPGEDQLGTLLRLRSEAYHLHRVADLQQDHLSRFGRGDLPWIMEENLLYFRDLYDNMARISHMADHLRERLAGMMETYHALVSRRALGATKTLALVVTLALPLCLLVGIYGTLFNVLPKFLLAGGHYGILSGIVAYLIISVSVFRKRRWF